MAETMLLAGQRRVGAGARETPDRPRHGAEVVLPLAVDMHGVRLGVEAQAREQGAVLGCERGAQARLRRRVGGHAEERGEVLADPPAWHPVERRPQELRADALPR